ncbi:MAG: LytTR family DNA-binding domain-containing protein [Bacteroidales bacterium]
MNLRKPIPDFFVRPLNTVIQIVFTSIFAYAFILIYRPFGSQEWFEFNPGQFAFYAGFVVVIGMLVVITSRVVMNQIRKRHDITLRGYALMISLEILAMTGFFMMIEKVFLKDPRYWFEVYYTAILNTALILLIPYLISLLYFAWDDNRRRLERLMRQKSQAGKPRFIRFHDENGEVRLTLNLDDLIYIEANENYVNIHYVENLKLGRFLLRNSLKKLEQELIGYPVVRCHRSFMINLLKIKLLRKNKTGYSALMAAPENPEIPVTETYRARVIGMTANQ